MRKAKIKTQRDSDNEMLEMFSHKFVQIPSSKRSPSIYKLLHSHWEGKKKKDLCSTLSASFLASCSEAHSMVPNTNQQTAGKKKKEGGRGGATKRDRGG